MSLSVDRNVARGLNTMGYWVATLFRVTGDTSYPTGGYSFPANLIKLGLIEWMSDIVCANSGGTAYIIARYNYATNKLQFYGVGPASGGGSTLTIIGGQAPGTALQVTPDSSSGVIGKTTAGNIAIPFSAGGSGAGAEVANLTNISAYSGIGLAVGKG